MILICNNIGCHIADRALWNEHNDDPDNRLYLSQ
jgi:hypothetical protein